MAVLQDTSAVSVSRTLTQLGLDEEDVLFGRFSRALLERGALAALQPDEAATTSGRLFRHSIAPHVVEKQRVDDNPRSFRISVRRNDGFAESNHRDAVVTSISAFDVEAAPASVSKHLSALSDAVNALSEPGSIVWRVRPAFAANRDDSDSSTSDESPHPGPHPALRVGMRVRTISNCAWTNSRWANVLLWILPALAALLYALSSNQTHATLFFATAFFVTSLLSLAMNFSRVETSFLLKELLCTFESMYLITWMLIFLVAFFVQIPSEIAARTVELGISATWYIFAQSAHAFAIVVCFAAVLCSDALVRLSVWFKVYMHCMFVLIAVFNWADDRFIHPNRIPVTICLGSATYSCTDTTRVRIGSLFAISLFVFRNMIIMLRHQYRLDAPILFGGMRTQRLLLIKSAVILNADESPESTATVEPESPPPGTALSHAATITETSNHSEEVPALSNGMRVLDIDDVPACESRPESAAACRDTDVSPGNPTSMLDSTSGPHVVSSPQSSSVDNALCSTSPNVLSLSMFSLFGIDVESRARAPRMLFGAAVSNLWRFSWFRGAAVSIFSTVLVLSFQNLPPNSLVVLCSLWTLVIIFSIVMLTLVDLRIVSELARTFEYWFLHMVNTVSFIAACSNLVNEADGAAAFIGNDRTLQLLNDICWNFIYFMGCALVVVADAVAIRRSLKIGLILFWISTLARVMWWRIWFTYQQPYMLPLDVCIWTECFSVQVIRLQASMTFILFSAKYVFSLFRFPRALVILKSTVVMGVVDDDTGRGVVADSDGDSDGASAPASGRSQSCIESGCDTVIAGTFPSDRTHASRRIPQ